MGGERITRTDGRAPSPWPGLSRRRLLAGGAVAGLGAALAVAGDAVVGRSEATDAVASVDLNGPRTEAFHGAHQAGIEMAPQAHQALIALDLLDGVGADGLRRMFRVVSDDAERMMRGVFALGDSEPEFAATPAGLTVTIGVGPEVVARTVGAAAGPSWLGPLPAFGIDELQDRWNGGDLLLQVASDDPTTVSHASRMLLKDLRSFAGVRWHQVGFRTAPGTLPAGGTMRNLLGQLDGTVNPRPGTEDFAGVVWHDGTGAPWLAGGTSIAVRRIEMLLDKWDRLDRSGREATIGRRLDDGAPLTGTAEHDEPDLEATTPVGFPVIAEFAHLRRARTDNPKERIFRRGYNYDLGARGDLVSDAGLIFTSFQADVDAQFVPIQARLDELDLLNEWTRPIGSAVFAILPGCQPGGFVGETLFA